MIIKSKCLSQFQTNSYLLIDEGTGEGALIDAPCFDSGMQSLLAHNEMKTLKHIILTHGHYDHISAAAEISAKYGAKILIHHLDAPCLSDAEQSLAAFTVGSQQNCKADVLLNDGDVIELGALKIKTMHTPGHTVGSCCFLVGGAVFSGDTLFKGTCGRTDLPGGDWQAMQASLQALAALGGDYKVYPGHSDSTTLDYERKTNKYINSK